MQPLVSVVVCTYNQEQYIAKALDSVLSQEVDFPFEIIVSDDCSTDGTARICREYQEKYPDLIRFYRNSCNKGLVLNYYDSVRLARGKYIADLAGDDWWVDNEKLARQAVVMESDPSIVLCHAAWKKYKDGDVFFETRNFFTPYEFKVYEKGTLTLSLLRHEKERYFVHLCTAMYRKDAVLQLIDEYPDLFLKPELPCEDLQLIVLLSAIGKIAVLPDCVLYYRVGHVSVSSTENPAKEVLFVCNVIRLTVELAKVLNIGFSGIRDYYRFDVQYALMQAFIAFDGGARNNVLSLVKDMDSYFKPSLKTKLTFMLSSNTLIWKVAKFIYDLVK